MNTIILDGIQHAVNAVVGGLVAAIGLIADGISSLALVQANLPWVQNAKMDIETVTWTILGFYVVYIAFTRYIMWGEGTADPDGSVLFKSILRTAIYVALSGFIATAMFQWGIALSGRITGGTMLSAAQSIHGLLGNATALPGSLIGLAIGLVLAILVGVLLLCVVCFQMAIRAAELVVYVIAAPLVGLGQMQSGGGVWNGWWTNLVILSLSQAVQMLCFVGLVESTQVLTTTTPWMHAMIKAGPTVGLPAAAGMAVISMVFAIFLIIGWLIVAIRGPHLLKQWSYHSGVGGGMMYVGKSIGGNALSGRLKGTRIGTFLKL